VADDAAVELGDQRDDERAVGAQAVDEIGPPARSNARRSTSWTAATSPGASSRIATRAGGSAFVIATQGMVRPPDIVRSASRSRRQPQAS
jgi:hypothetical protein